MKYEKRWYQEEAIEAWLPSLIAGEGNPLIAAPTGSGKSYMLAETVRRYLEAHPHNEILIVSHTQEIIKQDYKAVAALNPDVSVGIFSAGLGEKNKEQVTLGTVRSVYNARKLFRWKNLVLVDEAHAVNGKSEGMYREMLDSMHAQVGGVSATIFRMGTGYLHQGKTRLFDNVAYDLTTGPNFKRLIKEGYLVKPIPIKPETQLDSSAIKKSAGDFNLKHLAEVHNRQSVTRSALENGIAYANKNYKKWLVFCIDIDHADAVTEEFQSYGVDARALHSRNSQDRDKILQDFRDSKFRALVSVGMVTTGFDEPAIDCIFMLRPTMSPVLHIQMIGRGMRPHPGKDHCLVLDFAGNCQRLGPIDQVEVAAPQDSKGKGIQRMKECPECSTLCYPIVKNCPSCGHEFEFEIKLTKDASTADVVSEAEPEPVSNEKWYKVNGVAYAKHMKVGKPPSVVVTYMCGVKVFKEWLTPEHDGYAGRLTAHKLGYRQYKGPLTTEGIIENQNTMKKPSRILVDTVGKFPEIKDMEFTSV